MKGAMKKIQSKASAVLHKADPRKDPKKREQLQADVNNLANKGYLSRQSLCVLEDDLTSCPSMSPRSFAKDDPFFKVQDISPETVLKRWYDWEAKAWETKKVQVKIAADPFDKGSIRAAHLMLLVNPDGTQERLVAKKGLRPEDQVKEAYEDDVIMQSACQAIAAAFNDYEPAKEVRFVDAYMIQREDKQKSWWGVESYLQGKYVKHNNNFGFVNPEQRNTPQAFTHFSYEHTGGKLMIVDIQGVGDYYTDPQIHTHNGKGFGVGNMGQEGMDEFFASHWCNDICQGMLLEFKCPKNAASQDWKRTGTTWDGPANKAKAKEVKEFKMFDYVGDVKPKAGGARAEDLALLGINKRQYVALASAFNEVDTAGTGFLQKGQLFHVFEKAHVGRSKTEQAEEYVKLCERIDEYVDAKGRISFKAFLVCWTGNA